MGAGEELTNGGLKGASGEDRPSREGLPPGGGPGSEGDAGERLPGLEASPAAGDAQNEDGRALEPQAAPPEEKASGSGGPENAASGDAAGGDRGDTPQPPEGGRTLLRRRLLAAGIALAVLIGIGIIGWRYVKLKQEDTPADAGPKVVPVEVAEVTTGDVVKVVRLTGNVAARTEINVIPKIPGRIRSLSVDVGDRVAKGQVLVKLDDDEVLASLRSAEAALEVAKAGARAAQANLEDAKRNLERMQQLYDAGAISLQQLEQAQLRYDQAAAGVNDAQVRQAEAAVESARLQLENTVILSPIDGVVAARFADPGELAGTSQPLLTLVDISEVQVTCNVTGEDVNSLRTGQSVPVVVAAAGQTEEERRFTGRITSLAPAADARSKLFPVRISIPNPDGRLRPGMFAEIHLTTAVSRNAVRVPVDAVLERDGKKIVYVVEGDKARERRVETGITGEDYVEIRSGLKPGEKVVVTGQDFLVDGTRVQVSSGKTGGQRKEASR